MTTLVLCAVISGLGGGALAMLLRAAARAQRDHPPRVVATRTY